MSDGMFWATTTEKSNPSDVFLVDKKVIVHHMVIRSKLNAAITMQGCSTQFQFGGPSMNFAHDILFVHVPYSSTSRTTECAGGFQNK